VEFVINNKVYSVTKVSSFLANYNRELRIRADIRRKEKIEKLTKFVEKIKKNSRESWSNIEKSTKR